VELEEGRTHYEYCRILFGRHFLRRFGIEIPHSQSICKLVR